MTKEETIEVVAQVIEPSDALQVIYTPADITDNLAQLDAYVAQQIEPYEGWQLDPNDYEQIKYARDVVMVNLNKLKAPIEDERKRIKKVYETPLKAFEGRVKLITKKIDDARGAIKKQVDAANEEFKAQRYALLEEDYMGCAGAIADVIPFSSVLDPKWLNRSTLETKALAELGDKMEEAVAAYKTLQTKELKHKDEVVKRYADTLDLVGALQLEDELNERDRELAEFKARQEAAQAVAKQNTEPEVVPGEKPAPESASAPEVLRYSLAMEFEGTRQFAKEVAEALKAMGISGATIKCLGVVGHD